MESVMMVFRFDIWETVGLAASLIDSPTGVVAGLLFGATGLVLVAVGVTYWSGASTTGKGWEGEVRTTAELSYLSDEFLLLSDVRRQSD